VEVAQTPEYVRFPALFVKYSDLALKIYVFGAKVPRHFQILDPFCI
jgi:hypothetical protein